MLENKEDELIKLKESRNNDKPCPECKGCVVLAQSSITKLIKAFVAPANPQYFASDLSQHLIDNGVKL